MMNLTKKYKVSGNEHPAYREWEDDENNYTGCNQKSKLTPVAYKEKLIKKKWLPWSDEEPNDRDDDKIQKNNI